MEEYRVKLFGNTKGPTRRWSYSSMVQIGRIANLNCWFTWSQFDLSLYLYGSFCRHGGVLQPSWRKWDESYEHCHSVINTFTFNLVTVIKYSNFKYNRITFQLVSLVILNQFRIPCVCCRAVRGPSLFFWWYRSQGWKYAVPMER